MFLLKTLFFNSNHKQILQLQIKSKRLDYDAIILIHSKNLKQAVFLFSAKLQTTNSFDLICFNKFGNGINLVTPL
jgi:hypothetical protein